MMAFLAGGGGKLLLYLGAFLAIAGMIWKLVADIETIGAQKETIATLEKTNADNLAEIAKIQADAKAAQDALTASIAQERQRNSEKSTVQRIITNALPKDDGPVAPVLANTIDGLYPSPADSVGQGDQAGGAGGTPKLSGGSGKTTGPNNTKGRGPATH